MIETLSFGTISDFLEYFIDILDLAYQHELLPLSTNHEQQASSYLTKIVHKDYALAVKELEGFLHRND